jgi:hypothetical protein
LKSAANTLAKLSEAEANSTAAKIAAFAAGEIADQARNDGESNRDFRKIKGLKVSCHKDEL